MQRIYLFVFVLAFFHLTASSQPGFIENKGQWEQNILFKADIPGGALFLEKNCLTYNLIDGKDIRHADFNNPKNEDKSDEGVFHFHSYQVKFINSLPNNITYESPYSDYYNYFIGNNKSKWASKVKKYKNIKYNNLYENIDFRFYVNENSFLQYDFIVLPGGNPEDIKLNYKGQDKLFVDASGSLVVETTISKTTELKPFAYQEISGRTVKIPCTFLIRDGNVAFQFPNDYNHDYPLIIDPVLVFSTYSGSTTDNWGFTATFDDKSNVFSGGICFNIGYPTSLGAYQMNYPGNTDVGIIKYDDTGAQRLWATYFGGSTSAELPNSLVCNRNNELIFFGITGSTDLPLASNAYDNTFNGGTYVNYENYIPFLNGTDIYVSKLSSDGAQLLASTYIGGSGNDGFNFRQSYNNVLMQGNDSLYYNYADGARGEVICDPDGYIYVGSCTFSNNFPTTPGSFNQTYGGLQEGVIFKFDANLLNLVWSGYYGGSNDDAIYSLDIDNDMDVYVGGGTVSSNLITTPGVDQQGYQGGTADGFIAHISSNGASLVNSTYLGSFLYDQVYFVRVDKLKNVYATGQTKAPGTTFIINATYGTPNSGQFITKFPPDLSYPIWSTAFGTGNGRPNISITAFSVDYCNRLYLAGWGREWADYLYSWSSVFGTKGMDTTAGAFQTYTDGQDFYLMVLADDASHLEYATFFGEQHTTGYCGHDHVDGGTSRFDKRGYIYESVCASCGNTSSGPSCNGFPTAPNPGVWSPDNGGYPGTSWVCNNAVFKFSFELPITIADFIADPICAGDTMHFINTSQLATNYYWDFGDNTTSTDFEPDHVYSNPGTYNVSLIASHPTSCNLADSIVRTITVEQILMAVHDTVICNGNNVNISALVSGTNSGVTYHWSHFDDFSDTINSNPNANSINVNPGQSTTYYIQASSMYCDVIDSIRVNVKPVNITTSPDTAVCLGNSLEIHALNLITTDTLSYYWWPNTGIISGQNTADLQINPAQSLTYYVSVTNQFGCTKTDSIRVTVDQFTLSPGPVQNVQCFGMCNGALSVYPNNGNLPYTIIWNNNDTSSSVSNLCPGTYTVTVTDAIGCSFTIPFNITEPPYLNATITTLSSASCDQTNPNTGSIVVTPTGGTPNYSYHWNMNQTDSLIINLYSGHYIVTITDSQGCDTILSTDILDQSNLAIQTTSVNTQCYGSCDGSAQVQISVAGVPPYTYLWNTSSNNTSISNLCSGTYWVTVTDSEYCVRVDGIYVYQPDSLHTIISTPGINCFGGTTTATGSTYGGTSPYTFTWSTGLNGNSISGLSAGDYSLYVVDSHGCPDTLPFTITQPAILSYDTTITNVACAVACNGTIQLPVFGGTYPYSYDWSNDQNSSYIQNLCPGNYQVTVTDIRGCSFTDNFNVGINDYLPFVDATTNTPQIYVGQTANLFANTNPNYQINWSPTTNMSGIHSLHPTTTPTQTTTYQVTIEDVWGCTNTDTVTITVLDVICGEPYIYVPNAFTPNGDNNNDILYVKADIADELYFAIYDRWGEKVFSTTSTSKGWDGTYKGKALDPAVFVYYLKVTCINKLQFEKKGNITLIR